MLIMLMPANTMAASQNFSEFHGAWFASTCSLPSVRQENISMEKGHDREKSFKKKSFEKLNVGGEEHISRFIFKSIQRDLAFIIWN